MSDLDILSFIDDTFLQIEFNIKNENKVKELIKEARIKMYRYTSKVPKQVPKQGIVTMLYSEDIERLATNGFTDNQIAIITGIPKITIRKYLVERGLKK